MSGDGDSDDGDGDGGVVVVGCVEVRGRIFTLRSNFFVT